MKGLKLLSEQASHLKQMLDMHTWELQKKKVDYELIDEKISPLSYRQAILLRAALCRYMPEGEYDPALELTIWLPDESLNHIQQLRSYQEMILVDASKKAGNCRCGHHTLGQIYIEAEYKLWGEISRRVQSARSNPERKES